MQQQPGVQQVNLETTTAAAHAHGKMVGRVEAFMTCRELLKTLSKKKITAKLEELIAAHDTKAANDYARAHTQAFGGAIRQLQQRAAKQQEKKPLPGPVRRIVGAISGAATGWRLAR